MEFSQGNIIANRYELREILGRGSFGEVWLANDTYSGIDVAIKVFIALDQSGIEEFKSEFRNAFSLSHPNLLHATHFDIIENKPVLVMPYCPGKAESLIGSSMDERDVWRFIRDVASGLAYLHSKGVIHRDIKPDNILIDQDGDYLITDFGVSKKMEGTLRRNSTIAISQDKIAGTIGYMAPELFSSHPDTVKATDIWALGASLVEIINGELPFCGQGGGMLLRFAEMPEIDGNYSKKLQDTILSCLAKDTWDRPTAEQLVEIADAVLLGKVVATPATQPMSSAPVAPKKKSNAWKIISIFLGIAVAVGIFAIVGSNGRSQKTPSTPVQDALSINGQTFETANFSSDGGSKHCDIKKTFSDSWGYSDLPDWCTINAGTTSFTLECKSNNSSSTRTAKVDFYKNGSSALLASLEITQEGKKKDKADSKPVSSVTTTTSASASTPATNSSPIKQDMPLELNKNTLSLSVSESYQLYVTGKHGDLKWSSGDSSIAKVDNNGIVKGVKEGRVIISVQSDSGYDSCIVTVMAPPSPPSKDERFKSALLSSDYEELVKLADSGYQRAYIVCARHFLSTMDFEKAYKYAQKAKLVQANSAEAQEIINKVLKFGYNPEY